MTLKWITIDDALEGSVTVRYDLHQPNGTGEKPLRGRVVVLPGLTEFIEKHQDQIDGFAAQGLEVITLDWPGQGLSTRLAHGHPYTIHISDFALHDRAVLTVMHDAGVMDDPDTPLFIFGHSMGGHLGLRLARHLQDAEDLRQINLRGVMVSAPMIMIPVVLRRLTLGLLNLLCRLGLSRVAMPGQQGFSRNGGGFNPRNVLTRDPEGYALQHNLFEENPSLRTRGPSFGWIRAALDSCLATSANPEWLAELKLPVQAHLAGNELVVLGRDSAPKLAHIEGAEVYIYDDAKHELMLELPEVRAAIWDRMAQFIDDHITEGGITENQA